MLFNMLRYADFWLSNKDDCMVSFHYRIFWPIWYNNRMADKAINKILHPCYLFFYKIYFSFLFCSFSFISTLQKVLEQPRMKLYYAMIYTSLSLKLYTIKSKNSSTQVSSEFPAASTLAVQVSSFTLKPWQWWLSAQSVVKAMTLLNNRFRVFKRFHGVMRWCWKIQWNLHTTEWVGNFMSIGTTEQHLIIFLLFSIDDNRQVTGKCQSRSYSTTRQDTENYRFTFKIWKRFCCTVLASNSWHLSPWQ